MSRSDYRALWQARQADEERAQTSLREAVARVAAREGEQESAREALQAARGRPAPRPGRMPAAALLAWEANRATVPSLEARVQEARERVQEAKRHEESARAHLSRAIGARKAVEELLAKEARDQARKREGRAEEESEDAARFRDHER